MATPHSSSGQPRKNEDEYFTRQEAELIKNLRSKLDAERTEAERKQHFMRCPKCGGQLRETAQGDVKIDRCDDCHGIWLDPGELELIARAAGSSGPQFVENLLGFFQRKTK
jgi:hypothetical protein